MELLQTIVLNLRDARAFGPQFLLRHGAQLRGAATSRVNIPGIGPVVVRRSESDVATIRQVFIDGEYDLGETTPAIARVRAREKAILATGRTPVIVDAGANIGAASLWFAHRYPDSAIVAVEPEIGNFEILIENAKLRPTIHPVDAAIGSRSGFVEVQNNGLGWAARTVRAESGLKVITVDDAIASVPDGEAFIVKIDIEGFESDLFAENLEWISRTQMIIIEPHDWMLPGQGSSYSFQKALAQHDFEIFLSGENLVYIRA